MQPTQPAKSSEEEMPNEADHLNFELYNMYVQTAEKVSDRRGALNAWMISLANAIVALGAVLTKAAGAAPLSFLGAVLVSVSGILTCILWMALLTSYSKLNKAKFHTVSKMELRMEFRPFQEEREYYKQAQRIGFSKIEGIVPMMFAILFASVLAVEIFQAARQ
jgi:hypothetical protein